MVVTMRCRGRTILGLSVEAEDARAFFEPGQPTIELLIDHLQIQCGLTPEFWQGAGEIEDARLCAWLASKDLQKPLTGDAVPLALTPAGNNCYRLEPMPQINRPPKPTLDPFNPA